MTTSTANGVKPDAEIVTVPRYIPGAEIAPTLTVKVAGFPCTTVALSQLPPESVWTEVVIGLPFAITLTVCGAGALPEGNCNSNNVGDAWIAGGGGVDGDPPMTLKPAVSMMA